MSTDEKYQQDRVFDHDYDGIQEYDNRLPNWWLMILFGSIVFAVGYWAYHQTFGAAPTPDEHYQAEVTRAAEAQLARSSGKEMTDEALVLMSQVPERVTAGRQIFEQFCVVCHNQNGEGNVGPNLTDPYWLHGGKPLDILKTVTDGVPEKGMVAWGNQLGPQRVQAVVAYALTLKGKNLPGKAPQGEPETASAGAGNAGGDSTTAAATAAPAGEPAATK